MFTEGKIWMAQADGTNLYLLPKMANRHGLIAGATGTGKTITMKVMAESFSDMGVPVFFSDVKGDLTGMISPGINSEDMQKRINKFGIQGFSYKGYPTHFWDIFGEKGTPVRITISDMGPMLLSKLLNLTDVQAGVLSIVFKIADENGLLLLDFKDLRAMLQYVGDNRAEFTTIYGNVSSSSIGAIQRALLAFEDEGGTCAFGEPMLDVRDWMRTDYNGKGYINILSSSKLINSPTVYSTFLLWMLNRIYDQMPEVGDLDRPRMVFFFDEAHLLFADAPKALIQKIVQVVKLIRSKGIGVYFVTQSPSDIPDDVLAQLSNRIQHGLRAYTPTEMKAVKAAANSFRQNPKFDAEDKLLELGTGEALVSFLDQKGIPTVVEYAKILPPQSLMGAADPTSVTQCINSSEFELKYRSEVDRESAYEVIMAATEQLKAEQEAAAQAELEEKQRIQEEKERAKAEKQRLQEEKAVAKAEKTKSSKKSSTGKKIAQSATTVVASTVSTALARNLINSVTGGKKTDSKTIAKRAATNALSSVARNSSTALIRGIFGSLK